MNLLTCLASAVLLLETSAADSWSEAPTSEALVTASFPKMGGNRSMQTSVLSHAIPVDFFDLGVPLNDIASYVEEQISKILRTAVQVTCTKIQQKSERQIKMLTVKDALEAPQRSLKRHSVNRYENHPVPVLNFIITSYEQTAFQEEARDHYLEMEERLREPQEVCFRDIERVVHKFEHTVFAKNYKFDERKLFFLFDSAGDVSIDRVYRFWDALQLRYPKTIIELEEDQIAAEQNTKYLHERIAFWREKGQKWISKLKDDEKRLDVAVAELNRSSYGLFGNPWESLPIIEVTFSLHAVQDPTQTIEQKTFLLQGSTKVDSIKEFVLRTLKCKRSTALEAFDFRDAMIRFRGHTFDEGSLQDLFSSVEYDPNPFGIVSMDMYISEYGSNPSEWLPQEDEISFSIA